MNNSLMITILSNVVNQAPRVNQETVDNVKAIIAHLEKEDTVAEAPVAAIYDEPIVEEELENEPSVSFGQDEEVIKPKNRGGRPKKRK